MRDFLADSPGYQETRRMVLSMIDRPGPGPHSPVCVAFNSRNEMVVGNDGYDPDPKARNVNQLYL